MDFRKMVTITLYKRQQKRHRCLEQSFGLCGREREGGMIWDNGIETCIISYVKRKQKKERGGTNVKEDLPKQKMC